MVGRSSGERSASTPSLGTRAASGTSRRVSQEYSLPGRASWPASSTRIGTFARLAAGNTSSGLSEQSVRGPSCSMHCARQAARPPRPCKINSRLLSIIFNHPLDAPHNLVQARIVMLIGGAKTIDDHAMIVLSLGMDILMIVEGQADVRNLLAAKENQVAGAHVGALDCVIEKAVLLIRVAGNKVAAHAITELNEAAAIDALPACATPEIGYAEQAARVGRHGLCRLAGIGHPPLANLQGRTLDPGRALAGQCHLDARGMGRIQRGQARREVCHAGGLLALRGLVER